MTVPVIVGSELPVVIVWTPAPAIAKLIVSEPALALASWIAARRVQLPLESAQIPLPGLASPVSPLELTVRVSADADRTTAGVTDPERRTTRSLTPSSFNRIGSTATGSPETSSAAEEEKRWADGEPAPP